MSRTKTIFAPRIRQGRQADRLDNELVEDLRKFARSRSSRRSFLDRPAGWRPAPAVRRRHHGRDHHQGAQEVARFTSPKSPTPRHFYVKRKGDPSITSDQGPQRPRSLASRPAAALLGRLPELEEMLKKTGGKLGKVFEYNLVPEAIRICAQAPSITSSTPSSTSRHSSPRSPP